ncbi:MAG: extracellular solute-binding protein [Alphaproteobacteria bacterium]|nr:extracellular solute-binding protein [Alphaproteobacteria bacterium]
MKKTDTKKPAARVGKGLTRRQFTQNTALTGTAFAAASFLGGQAPAIAQERKLHYLQWSSFIGDADPEISRQAEEFTKATGVDVTVEFINQNDMAARITAAIESGSGADVIQMNANQPHLYASGLADHGDLFGEMGGDDFYEWAAGAVTVDGVARSIPLFNIGNAVVYRKDLFAELGLSVPNTWEEYLTVGQALKNANMPVGQTLGHTFGDAPSFAYPLMWSYGGQEVDEDGNVVINSPETHAALEFMARFWEAACDPGGLAWDDGSNNRAFLGQTIATSLNGASIYFVARKDADKYPGLADNCDHFLNPEGPNGRYHFVGPRSLSIMEYSEEKEAAAELIRHFAADDNFDAFMNVNKGYVQGSLPKWEDHPIWESDPALTIYRDNPKYGRTSGYAGPWNRASGEAQEKYIIVDMFARAVQGEDPETAAAWAQQELENVYGA